jgi:hypothetical protein
VSASVQVSQTVSVAVAWRHESAYDSAIERSGFASSAPDRNAVEYHPPDVFRVSATARRGPGMITVEGVVIGSDNVYQPLSTVTRTDNGPCGQIADLACGGWGFGNYRPSNAIAVHTGGQWPLPFKSHSLVLRGGASFNTGYSDSTSEWTGTGGLAFRGQHVDVATGLAASTRAFRLLADLRYRF